MPFSLGLSLYKLFQRRIQSEFEKKNKLLDTKSIQGILSDGDPSKIIQVFRSAVVDHVPVEGRPYYLSPPVTPLFYHDNFKKCLIAEGLGRLSARCAKNEVDDVLSTLNSLSSPLSAGCVQIFAWESLGRWTKAFPESFVCCFDRLKESMGGATASVLGGVLFLEHVLSGCCKEKASSIIQEIEGKIVYRVQKALFYYFVSHNKDCYSLFKRMNVREKNIKQFLGACENFMITSEVYFKPGLKEIGLTFGRAGENCWDGTQQADIILRLRKLCGHYLAVIGFFLERW